MGDFKNSQMMLSEYGGCTYAFSGFFSFNSFDLQEFQKTLDKALSATE
jgi:trehalose-6-phosphate synthase